MFKRHSLGPTSQGVTLACLLSFLMFGLQGCGSDNSALSYQEFKDKLKAKSFKGIVRKSDLISAFGKPMRIQQEGGKVYLYYQIADGVLQIEGIASYWNGQTKYSYCDMPQTPDDPEVAKILAQTPDLAEWYLKSHPGLTVTEEALKDLARSKMAYSSLAGIAPFAIIVYDKEPGIFYLTRKVQICYSSKDVNELKALFHLLLAAEADHGPEPASQLADYLKNHPGVTGAEGDSLDRHVTEVAQQHAPYKILEKIGPFVVLEWTVTSSQQFCLMDLRDGTSQSFGDRAGNADPKYGKEAIGCAYRDLADKARDLLHDRNKKYKAKLEEDYRKEHTVVIDEPCLMMVCEPRVY